jgi:hypothetical protein
MTNRVLPAIGRALAVLALLAAVLGWPGAWACGGMRDLTSVQLSREMVPGINLGNTMEAIPNETAWGNPVPTQALMRMQVVTRSMVRQGLVPMLWDTRGLIDRHTGVVKDPGVLRAIAVQ